MLDNAGLAEGDTVLNVGCGDGLIAFGALERIASGTVIFSDISQELLDHAQSLAQEMGLLDRCRFLLAPAEDLSALEDASVDVVTTRSVLIYVAAKQQAFKEFYRVLKSGGRLSIFEPINRFSIEISEQPHCFAGFDVTPVMDIAQKVKALYQQLQPRDSNPMLNFDERDLIAYAEQAGFKEIHLELQAKVTSPKDGDWEAFLRAAGNPKIPTLEEAMRQVLTPEETARFVARLRPLVEARQGVHRSAVAYLWAVK
ncbi:MAG: class I SAM-dependent methyltransferase [Roseiflexaceae bacterium]|nr:class I SAM-dependent methyltransferase [Roseiflexaceae bacterium]